MKAILAGALAACAFLAGFGCAQAQTPPVPAANSFAIPQTGLTFVTGDTWEQNGQRIRLYGVQSCIRGTSFTNAVGTKQDCGEASLAMLAALIKDTHPTCTPVAQIPAYQGQPATILAVCAAHIGKDAPDLGTIMITQGFAFAAFTNQGIPVYKPYLVEEALAKRGKTGLWASPDFTHPNAILFKAVNPNK